MGSSRRSGSLFAAVDLGSNSFHMVVARADRGDLRLVDRHREQVQLAAGLDGEGRLDRKAQQRALDCLERFGQSLSALRAAQVRAVGTNTLRVARNARPFLERARKVLGRRIEVISGREEARLIYLGVAHTLADGTERRLVVDIGGGSTECIVGEGFEPELRDSLYMGCVAWSRKFFPGGRLRKSAFKRAELAARSEFQSLEERYRAAGWDDAVGASGTIVAVGEILRLNGWDGHGITKDGLRRLRRALCDAEDVRALRLRGLREERAPILPGGLAILLAAFESLGIEQMDVSSGSLREGVLYDLLGRMRHEDARDRTVQRMAERHRVDAEQAARVERTALGLFKEVAKRWKLDEEARRLLVWAARLHEIGLSIAYSGYHKHSAYLVANSDMPGFSRDDQELIALLIRAHRRKVSPRIFANLPFARYDTARRLAAILRLAVLLHRGRSPSPVGPIAARARKKRLALSFPAGFFRKRPLTRADLEDEAEMLERLGFEIEHRARGRRATKR